MGYLNMKRVAWYSGLEVQDARKTMITYPLEIPAAVDSNIFSLLSLRKHERRTRQYKV